MAQKPFTSETVVEALSTFESGVDSGVAPQLLKPNQLSFGTNLTVRGAFASHRPPFTKQALDYGGNAAMQTAVEQGHFQGWCYYKPDNVLTPIAYVIQSWTAYAMEQIVASISGRIFVFTPDTTIPNLWHVTDVTIPGDANDPNAPQVWLWQAEKWMIITDGTLRLPIYFNGTYCRRSIGNDMNVLVILQAGTDANYVANGSTWNITLQNAPAYVWALGTPISGVEIGEYVVSGLGGLPTQYVLTRTSTRGPNAGDPAFVSPNIVQIIYPELPAGRVGCYGMGRVWMSLTDAKQFIGGDINGGPSGTKVEDYRDAVLHTSENSLIAGGGAFSTPGAWGDIRAMIFAATLDVSLGQGPLQVLTPTGTFSCYAPTDRTTWQSVTNPILTESLITNGSETFYGTVQANGDVIFRSVDGIRTLILGRRDFATWGNVPASSEMDRILSLDAVQYLRYVSAIVFDNRLLMTCSPNSLTGKGVFFNGLIALNFDPLSNLRGKLPAAFDGLWTGLNVLQLLVGRFNNMERAYAFTTQYDPTDPTKPSELYEINPTPKDVYSPISVFEETDWQPNAAIYDNGKIPIVWTGESSVMFKAANLKDQDFHRLIDGEILVDNLQGSVDFALFYKPDQYPCWIPWLQWTECSVKDSPESKAQFRPRMGLGEPSSKFCDVTTKRALREGYTFQIKWIIQGHCRFLGFRAKAISLPQPMFAAPNCKAFCLTLDKITPSLQSIVSAPITCSIIGSPPDGVVCNSYNYQFSSIPAGWTFSGNCPTGLNIDNTGNVTGYPNQASDGPGVFNLTATDGRGNTCTKQFTINITGANGCPKSVSGLIWNGTATNVDPHCAAIGSGIGSKARIDLSGSWQYPDNGTCGEYSASYQLLAGLDKCADQPTYDILLSGDIINFYPSTCGSNTSFGEIQIFWQGIQIFSMMSPPNGTNPITGNGQFSVMLHNVNGSPGCNQYINVTASVFGGATFTIILELAAQPPGPP